MSSLTSTIEGSVKYITYTEDLPHTLGQLILEKDTIEYKNVHKKLGRL